MFPGQIVIIVVFRFRFRFNAEYGIFSDFTELWDRLQVEENCCGVLGPHDYSLQLNRSYPASCCGPEVFDAVARKPFASAVVFRTTTFNNSAAELVGANANPNLTMDGGSTHLGLNHILAMATAKQEVVRNITPLCQNAHQTGCVDRLASWLKSRADILFVLGYCVIAFLKLSFLGILRYEIREMIQKIKLLQTEMANNLCSDTEPQSATVSLYGNRILTPLCMIYFPSTARALRPTFGERDQHQ